jgi:hypothetical protein
MTTNDGNRPQGLVLGELPDEILDWHGPAAELAAKCAEFLPKVGLPDDVALANERLIRHYVQMGVIDRPDAQGFGAQHVFDFLAARALLKDGWSLSKIAELRASRPDGLTSILPSVTQGETPAEATVRRLREQTPTYRASTPQMRSSARPTQRESPVAAPEFAAMETLAALTPDYAPQNTLGLAAEISQRRRELKASLAQMGNPSGDITRRRTLELTLTPWCTVHIDTALLQQASPDLLEQIGKALTQALHEERTRRTK